MRPELYEIQTGLFDFPVPLPAKITTSNREHLADLFLDHFNAYARHYNEDELKWFKSKIDLLNEKTDQKLYLLLVGLLYGKGRLRRGKNI